MLIKKTILDGIVGGGLDLAFRRWDKPAVKPDSVFKTAVGLIRVTAVAEIDPARITAAEARRAGFESADAVRAELATRAGAKTYRIALAYAGEDPRLALRARNRISAEERDALIAKLDRLDAGKAGAWTRSVLEIIRDFPATPAGDLAARLGVEKEWLKLNVRKLKNLGLTISLEPGYKLSPRGKAFLKAWKGIARVPHRRRA
jgi:hypothetical protein